MGLLIFISNGGGTGGDVSLQTAYDGGHQIVLGGSPIDIVSISPGAQGLRLTSENSDFVIAGADGTGTSLVLAGSIAEGSSGNPGGGFTAGGGVGGSADSMTGTGGDGGSVVLGGATGGSGGSTSGDCGDGGSISLFAGEGGGTIGAGDGGDGGTITLVAGEAGISEDGTRGDGGHVNVTAGSGYNPGNITLTAGNGDFQGGGGVVMIGGTHTADATCTAGQISAGPSGQGAGGNALAIAGSADDDALRGADLFLGGGQTDAVADDNTGGFARLSGGSSLEDGTALGGNVIIAGGPGGLRGGSLYISAGAGSSGVNSGGITIGLNGTLQEIPEQDGGVSFDPDGVAYFNNHELGAPEAEQTTGSIRLHIVSDDEEGRLPDTTALFHYRSTPSESGARAHGFRGKSNGEFGLFARGYQNGFSTDGVETTFNFSHNLNTRAPLVQVYTAGSPYDRVSEDDYTCAYVDGALAESLNDVQLVFTPALPEGDYWVTIVGF